MMNENHNKLVNQSPIYGILFSLILLQIFILIAALFYVNNQDKAPDFILFLGRFHPLLLHYPIGILSLMFFLRAAQFISGFNNYHSVYNIIWLVATPSTTIAALLGILLSANSDYNADLLYNHKLFGSALAFSFLIASFFRLQFIFSKMNIKSAYHRIFFLITILLLPITGHDGGSLTHGSKYLYKYLPDSLDFFNLKETQTQTINTNGLNDRIIEIFKKHCFKCHSEEKQKGDYRLDTREFALRGGESDEIAIVPGNALQSFLFNLISLHATDEEIMPPEGKGSLTAQNILDIKYWIDAGAQWPSKHTKDENNTNSKLIAKNTELKIENNTLNFKKHIWPIIKEYCLKCHQAPYIDKKGKNKKPSAGLRLDTAELIMKGSKNEKVIIKGKPEESSFYTLTALDPDDDDIMPSKGDTLTKEQQKLIFDWILNGADFGDWEKAE